MRIGFAIPSIYSFTGPGNGVRVQAESQARALTALGHEVVLLNPWTAFEGETFDVVHFFMGGFALQNIEGLARLAARKVSFAPIIDSNEPNWRYRLAVRLGTLVPRVFTIPGELRRQAVGSDLVICRSKQEQQRVTEGLGVDIAKTRIVLNGIFPPPAADVSLVRDLLGFDGPFVLHVSAYTQARKNVIGLIKAVGPTGLPLVIAGSSHVCSELSEIERLEKQFPNVHRLGYLSEAQRNALYAACRVFALPSFHEGTGLVALEAAAHGASVVITRNGGTADYFQNHATLVDPLNVDEIRSAIVAAFNAPASGAFKTHVLQNLTWEQSAKDLAAAFQSVVGRG